MSRTASFTLAGAISLVTVMGSALWLAFGGEVYFAYLAGVFLSCF